ncbi:leucine-rich repeat receptor-like protein kinase PXC1 [Cryptomeria japonica]|uniref:leucine-rich repeat receptor-like protein kinase PXC1 n=1 Tax=Cryptomeria japonica TaxID=3369 RepID=UPI0027DA6982|nr:leucine-rich repeat receptor-like protein kinase PXC1 [Cryptomeria japonica]
MAAPLLLLMLVTLTSITTSIVPVSSISVNDTEVLLEFKALADSHQLLNWSTSDACRDKWQGITCENGRVFFVSLSNYNLRGPIDPLGRLDQLRLLNLQSNRLNGSLDALSHCSNLKLVYLSSNDFSGSIPPEFSLLKRLLRLDLSNNNLHGQIPSGFRNLSRLLTLELQNNILTGPVPDLSFLTQFNVSNNQLSGEISQNLVQKFSSSAFIGNAGLCGKSPPFSACPVLVPSNPSPDPDPNPGSIPSPKKGSKTLSTGAIVAIVVGDAAVLILIALVFVAYYWRKYAREARINRKSGVEKTDFSGAGTPEMERSKLVFFDRKKQFELEDLLRASAEMLGKGSFGTAYKAVLDDGCVVAVKRLKDVSPLARKDFEQHMEMIGKLRHPNIVKLRAYYYAKEEKLLVYDYLPNGSLYSLLHGNRGPGRTPLDWTTRISLVLGAARGLSYIHEEYGSLRVPHGNIKSSNILLDKNGNACISDFGLALLLNSSHVSTRLAGYRAPEQNETKKLSQKADVYSFGVLLLEILTGKAPVHYHSQEEGVDLPKWVQSIVREEWTAEVFDLELMRYKNIEEEMVSMLQIALTCVSQSPEQRPKMSEVVKMIEDIRVEQSPHGEWDESHSVSPSISEDIVNSY